nr:polyadenylate-binding protein RBP47C-like isoform X2 [Arachis hypogaea]XP_029149343.1 polyadenylate-binding protein RBP47C-like isoform X2 [Arachis hypogaea]
MEQSNGSDSPQQNQHKQQQPSSDNHQPQQPKQQQRQHPPAVAVPTQQWMPYPAAAMVMQHHMLPPQHYAPPHYVPYHHPYHAPAPPPPPHVAHHNHQQHQHGSGGGENKTVWVGDLHHWMDENYLHRCFASAGEISSIKVIRNKQTGLSEGYGFVEFHSHATAEKVLQSYAGILMPNTEQPFRLNWATFSTGEKSSDNVPDLSIFVGDLAADVTDSLLHETFASVFPSVKAAKVVFDANTGRSKGYGFVRFGDDSERTKAMTQMNGVYCSSRPMRIGAATPRKSSGHQGGQANGASSQSEADSTNTTFRMDFGGNHWNGTYYGAPVYDGYGYALPPPHDPSIYAAAYAAYPIYGGHQQQVN